MLPASPLSPRPLQDRSCIFATAHDDRRRPAPRRHDGAACRLYLLRTLSGAQEAAKAPPSDSGLSPPRPTRTLLTCSPIPVRTCSGGCGRASGGVVDSRAPCPRKLSIIPIPCPLRPPHVERQAVLLTTALRRGSGVRATTLARFAIFQFSRIAAHASFYRAAASIIRMVDTGRLSSAQLGTVSVKVLLNVPLHARPDVHPYTCRSTHGAFLAPDTVDWHGRAVMRGMYGYTCRSIHEALLAPDTVGACSQAASRCVICMDK